MKLVKITNERGEREVWLEKATNLLLPFFEEQGASYNRIKVSCGFPFGSKNAIGQCFQASASKEKFFEIFISPVLEDEVEVLATLIHELAHASLPPRVKHGKPFKQLVYSLSLKGRATATVADEDFETRFASVLKKLGKYPHAKIKADKVIGGKPKQTTRLLKAVCSCGYTIRLSKSWADQGMPTCPCGEKFELENNE